MVTDLNTILPDNWKNLLQSELQKDYFKELNNFVKHAYLSSTIYPDFPELFSALKSTQPDTIKVVILGQDPYHGPNQANGLSFSVNPGEKIPPSLKNIFKELNRDLNMAIPHHGDLSSWANQGVLLLNNVLSVEAGKANSHQNKGWELFTSAIIQLISSVNQNLIFMLWGNHAQSKVKLLDLSNHHVLVAPHPSPLSAHRGFIGCGHFSETNRILKEMNLSPINWQLDA